MILVHSWRSLQTTFPTRAMEWFFGLALTNLGFIFWLTPDLFEKNRGWDALAAVADQDIWSNGCLVVGILRLGALMINGLWLRTPALRCAMAFLSCYVWWKLGVGLVGNAGLGAALLPLCFIFDAFNAIRIGREVGVSEFVIRRLNTSADTTTHARLARLPSAD